MEDDFEKLVSSLHSSTVSDEIIRGIILSLQEHVNGPNLTTFVSNSFSTLEQLQRWIWKSLTESFESSSFSELIESIAGFNKKLIYDFGSISDDTKAALIFSTTIDQVNEIFNHIDRCEDDNDPFITRISSVLENCAYFLHDNPLYEKLPVIEHIGQHVISHYVMTDRYKTYLGQLREEQLPISLFTARFLFYIRTCSFCCYCNLIAKIPRLNYTPEQIMNFLGDDYMTIIHVHSHTVSSWSKELLGCMAHLIGLMCAVIWWDGQKRKQISIVLPTETVACQHAEDLLRMIAHQPFYQQTGTIRWNNETVLMDSLLLALFLIVQTQNINWFFRTNPFIQETIINVASAALNDEIGLCGYAILGEVLNDDQLKDLKIGNNICNFFFTMLDEAWLDQGKKYKQMPIEYLLKGFQTLAKNDCIQQRTASLNKIKMFIDTCDLFPISYDIIWGLSFNIEIQEQLRTQTEFLSKLTQLAHHSTNDQMRKIASGILWNLSSHEYNRFKKSTKEEEKFDIMISYSHKDKQLCRQLYDELIKRGFRIWIDFDQMHGNVMDAMAQAIEHSQMVIICMSEDYRRSNFCRAEAQYAFQRQLKMVPVLLQKHYKPDGWLSFVLGPLLYIDFTKHEFSKAMAMLLKELHPHSADPSVLATSSTKRNSLVTVTNDPDMTNHQMQNISEWTKEQVQEWLITNELLQLSRLFKQSDGRSLLYLHRYLRHDEKRDAVQLLDDDARRRLNEHVSLIELCQFQSLIDRERRLYQLASSVKDTSFSSKKS